MKNSAILLPVVLSMAACVEKPKAPPIVGLANPASVYCSNQGGMVMMTATAAGETGYCHLPDGSVIEEWEYYRANNP